MARQPDRDRDIAVRAIAARDVTQAVGRVRQPVQEHHRADRIPLRLQHVGAVPVLREAARVYRAAFEVAVDRHAFCRIQFRRDLGAHVVEHRLLGREIPVPIGMIDLIRAHFGRRVDMPELEREAALRIVDADPDQRDQDRGEQQRCALHEFQHSGSHRPGFVRISRRMVSGPTRISNRQADGPRGSPIFEPAAWAAPRLRPAFRANEDRRGPYGPGRLGVVGPIWGCHCS